MDSFIVISLIKAAVVFAALMGTLLYLQWVERKVIAHIQVRPGPYRVGPHGLLQPIADVIKLLTKEDLMPPYVNKPLYLAAPFIAMTMALLSIAVIPFGPTIEVAGYRTWMQLTDLNIGVLFVLAVYGPVAKALARVRLGAFTAAVAPASALGFSTTSSMAALPAMMDIAVRDLRISAPVASFVLPLGATINRPGTGLYHVVAAVFLAALYGVPLGATTLAIVAATTFLMTLSVPAVPSGNLLALAPVLLAAGVPLEGMGLLFGVDRIPDMFRTGTNVTGHMVAAAVVARGEGESVMGDV
jgi:Na+/H+-dicarboxylate symporter